ncbi:MAG TPA: acyl carrier protein [Opitutae bacterium]|nr:acyl carrier protein [Opitutae bacterium]
MSLDQFIEDFEEAVEDVEVGTLSPSTNYRQLEQWDSLSVLTVIAMVDADYDVRLKADDLKGCESLEALFAHIQSKASS